MHRAERGEREADDHLGHLVGRERAGELAGPALKCGEPADGAFGDVACFALGLVEPRTVERLRALLAEGLEQCTISGGKITRPSEADDEDA